MNFSCETRVKADIFYQCKKEDICSANSIEEENCYRNDDEFAKIGGLLSMLDKLLTLVKQFISNSGRGNFDYNTQEELPKEQEFTIIEKDMPQIGERVPCSVEEAHNNKNVAKLKNSNNDNLPSLPSNFTFKYVLEKQQAQGQTRE